MASQTDRDLLGLRTMVLRAVRGATRLSRAKDFFFVLLTSRHRISPLMHIRYKRILWMVRGLHTRQDQYMSSCKPCGTATTSPRQRRLSRAACMWSACYVGSRLRAGGPRLCWVKQSRCTWCSSPCGKSSTGCGTSYVVTHAPIRGPPPINLWRARGRVRRGCLPRGTSCGILLSLLFRSALRAVNETQNGQFESVSFHDGTLRFHFCRFDTPIRYIAS